MSIRIRGEVVTYQQVEMNEAHREETCDYMIGVIKDGVFTRHSPKNWSGSDQELKELQDKAVIQLMSGKR